METIYKVNGKEFDNKNAAQQYENTLLMEAAKFRNGDRVYFTDGNGVGTTVVTEVCVGPCGTVMYGLAGFQSKKMEKNLYGSFDEYVEHLKDTINDYAYRD